MSQPNVTSLSLLGRVRLRDESSWTRLLTLYGPLVEYWCRRGGVEADAADVLGDDRKALEVYQRLKLKLIGGLPDEDWILTEAQVRRAIDTIEQAPKHAR